MTSLVKSPLRFLRDLKPVSKKRIKDRVPVVFGNKILLVILTLPFNHAISIQKF